MRKTKTKENFRCFIGGDQVDGYCLRFKIKNVVYKFTTFEKSTAFECLRQNVYSLFKALNYAKKYCHYEGKKIIPEKISPIMFEKFKNS